MTKNSTLTDCLYEAALVPELWPDVCKSLAVEAGAAAVGIFTIDHHGSYRHVTSPNIAELTAKFVTSDAARQNIRPSRVFELSPFSFCRDRDLLTPEEMATDPSRHDFLYPNGLDAEIGWAFQEPSGHIIAISVMR